MIKTKLRPYQQTAVQRALEHDGFALLMDMRTGKTLTALAVAEARKDVTRVLVVCPKRAIGVWHSEIAKHLENTGKEFKVLNYEAIALNRKLEKELLKWGPDLVILDEMHRIKNRTSKQAKACHRLGAAVPYRLGLTGTAISQGPQDAFSQFKFVDPTLFPARWADFRDEYLIMGGYLGRQIIGHRQQAKFSELVHSRSYRVTLNEVTATATRVRHSKVIVDLRESRIPYNRLKDELVLELGGKEIQSPIIVAKLQKLQQIAGGAVLMDDGSVSVLGSEKLVALRNLLLHAEGKVVIFARYLHELDRIRKLAMEMRLSTQTVCGLREYTGNFGCDIVIVQIQSGLAIDLSEADVAIFYSTDFSYVNFQQAKARILAHGKQRVIYYYLISKDTVDSSIYRALSRKTNVARLICDEYRKKSFT